MGTPHTYGATLKVQCINKSPSIHPGLVVHLMDVDLMLMGEHIRIFDEMEVMLAAAPSAWEVITGNSPYCLRHEGNTCICDNQEEERLNSLVRLII